MPASTLIRLGGLSAILAGLLRAGSSFIPYLTTEQGELLEVLYLITDVLILLGLLGVYGYQHEQAGHSGFIGFLLALIGTAIIVGPDGRIGSVEMYMAGALMISIGVLVLAIGTWKAGQLPRSVPILWAGSTVVGLGGFVLGSLDWTFLIAGVTFGLAFLVAGITIWRDPGQKQAA
ncbi:MAG TPA: hypothetical protein VFO91_00905 [Anaerolineales bacterium]|nr:hypothetical protein [Anaerolineales bacterium]